LLKIEGQTAPHQGIIIYEENVLSHWIITDS